MAKSIYDQMLATAAGVGLIVIPKERQYQLLALVHVFGDEAFVFNSHLKSDVMYAAKTIGLEAGMQPDSHDIEILSQYVDELRCGNRPDWLTDIEARYGISFPAWNASYPYRDNWREQVHGGVRISQSEHRQAGQR